MNSRWFVVSPVQNSWSGLAVLSMCVRGMRSITNSNGDGAFLSKIPTFIGTAPNVSAPHVSSTLQNFIVFPKNFTIFLLFPLCLSFLSPWSEGPCHKFSDSWSMPVLSSSSFVLLPEEASYLCLTIVIRTYSLEKRAEPAVLHTYVENLAILEPILLYRAWKCKQTKEQGSEDCLWTHIFTFL